MPTDLPSDWIPEEEKKRREELATSGRAVFSAVNWLYWVAGVTLVNGLMVAFGQKAIFGTLGLGITRVADDAIKSAKMPPAMSLVSALLAAGFVVALAVLAKRHPWAFVVAVLLLTADTVLLFAIKSASLINILLRFWVVGALMNGLISLQKIKASAPAS
jgi:hypothetical protein